MFPKLFLFFVLLINICIANDRVSAVLPSFEAYVEKSMEEWKIPGVAVAIVKDGKIVYLKGFGVQKVGEINKVDEHTVFPLASLTKNFTATLMAQLVSEGKIKWDDKVIQYLPDFAVSNSQTTQQFTIRDLLSHRSGLVGFSGDTFWHLGFRQNEIMKALKSLPIVAPFRQEFGYQNHLVGIAGLVIEKVTGKTISELMQERFFNLLSMKDSSVGLEPILQKISPPGWKSFIKKLFSKGEKANIAIPHDVDSNGNIRSVNFDPTLYTFPASTGINSSISDMAKWMIFQLNKTKINGKEFVSSENFEQLFTPYVESKERKVDLQVPSRRINKVQYGMGWFLYDYGLGDKRVNVVGHMAGMLGTRGLLALVPSENLGIIILSNMGGMRVSLFPEGIRSKFLDLYLDLANGKPDENIDWAANILKSRQDYRATRLQNEKMKKLQTLRPAASLGTYVGEYENSLYGKVTVTEKNNQLFLSYKKNKDIVLTHWNGDEFNFDSAFLAPSFSSYYDQGIIEFGSVKNKKTELLVISLMYEGKDTLFKRVP